jgi:voltage-gated potassium channel
VASDTPEPTPDAALGELFEHAERVPLVYWKEFTGAKSTVLLLGVVSVLAFVTGLSHLSQGAAEATGPLAGLLRPAVRDAVPIFGVVLAFLLAVVTGGLQRRLRVAWYAAVALLPVAVVLPLVTARATDVLLLLGSLAAVPLVVRNREGFDQPLDLSPFQVAAIASLVAVQVYGTVGAYVLQEQYNGIETWTDAFYYIVVTGTTVGYGDATPTTQLAKLFTLSVLVIGTAAFGATFGSLLVPALEERITSAFGNMNASQLSLLEDHVLVLGYGDLTEPLLDELVSTTDVVVLTTDPDVASSLRDRGVNVLTADPTDGESLLDARVDTASGVVVATADDARDALAILAVRQVNPDVRVIAAATDQRHVDKLEDVGADTVISPAVIGGRLLGRAVKGETDGLLEFDDGIDDGEADGDAVDGDDAGSGPEGATEPGSQ